MAFHLEKLAVYDQLFYSHNLTSDIFLWKMYAVKEKIHADNWLGLKGLIL